MLLRFFSGISRSSQQRLCIPNHLRLRLGGLSGHLPVCRGEGGIFGGNFLIVLRQLPTVIFHWELEPTRNRKVSIGQRHLAVLLGLRFRGGALPVVVGRNRLMVCRALSLSHRLLDIELLCRCRTSTLSRQVQRCSERQHDQHHTHDARSHGGFLPLLVGLFVVTLSIAAMQSPLACSWCPWRHGSSHDIAPVPETHH